MAIVSLKELIEKRPAKSRLMAIDHSKSAWGLALANPELTIVTPFKTIVCTKFSKDVVKLAELYKEYEVGGFVIGLPVHMDGTPSPRTESVRHFADNLINAQNIFGDEPLIAFWDERLSTDVAKERSIHTRSDVVDALAAQYILEQAIDYINKN